MQTATADVQYADRVKKDAIMIVGGTYGCNLLDEPGMVPVVGLPEKIFTVLRFTPDKQLILRVVLDMALLEVSDGKSARRLYALGDEIHLNQEETISLVQTKDPITGAIHRADRCFSVRLTGLHSQCVSTTPLLDSVLAGGASSRGQGAPRNLYPVPVDGEPVLRLVVQAGISAEERAHMRQVYNETVQDAKRYKFETQVAGRAFYGEILKNRVLAYSNHAIVRTLKAARYAIDVHRVGKEHADLRQLYLTGRNADIRKYTREQLAVLKRLMFAERLKRESKADEVFSSMMQRLIMGRGAAFTPAEMEVTRTHISASEDFSVQAYIQGLPDRHGMEWELTDVESIVAVRDHNLYSLQMVEDFNMIKLHLAIMRHRLLEPQEPLPQAPQESDSKYNVYLRSFEEEKLRPGDRLQVEGWVEKYVKLLEQQKKDIVERLGETFATRRLLPGMMCYVNVSPEKVCRLADFENGTIEGYDMQTGLTKVTTEKEPKRSISVVLPDFRVRFDPECMMQDPSLPTARAFRRISKKLRKVAARRNIRMVVLARIKAYLRTIRRRRA